LYLECQPSAIQSNRSQIKPSGDVQTYKHSHLSIVQVFKEQRPDLLPRTSGLDSFAQLRLNQEVRIIQRVFTSSTTKLIIAILLVAGTGFEPVTFGL
jgi:hypothetical protein